MNRNLLKPHRVKYLLLALALLLAYQLLLSPLEAEAAATPDQVSDFRKLWTRTDDLVYDGIVNRSWVWGPKALDYGYKDKYRYSNKEKYIERAFRHYDKGRMEIDPRQPRGSQWYIRGGNLVKEMVMGKVQTSEDGEFNKLNPLGILTPAEIPVVGDPVLTDMTPTYASFSEFASVQGDNRAAERRGQSVVKLLNRDGYAVEKYTTDDPKAELVAYENVTGHNIPRAFKEYFEKVGTVLDASGNKVKEQLLDPLYIFGYPITEPYWARVPVGGKPTMIMLQLFERRVLSYTPTNTPEWQVEMGNVGRHYLDWRTQHDLSFVSSPRISLGKFTSVLKSYNSPVTNEAGDLYATIVSYGLDPGVALAFFVRESGAGTAVGYCNGQNSLDNKNWGNVRGDENGACGFMKFNSWKEGLVWWCKGMYKYFINRGLNRMEDAIPVYAPAADGNNVNEYLTTMYQLLLRWQGYRV